MKPTILLILDGWGYSKDSLGNAILNAKTPNLDMIEKEYPMYLLQASGKAVGMSWGEPGNSEVGHLTIGSGRIILQYSSRINNAIDNGSFHTNPVFLDAISETIESNKTVHLAGLLTSGSVHASFDHILALVKTAQDKGSKDIKLHIFTDGKDSELDEAPALLETLKKRTEGSNAKITTLIGRDYAMNRTGLWEKTKEAFELIVNAKGEASSDLITTLRDKYTQGLDDSHMPPILVDPGYAGIKDGDALILWNFREDSMRQIARAFDMNTEFKEFNRGEIKKIYLTTMTPYLDDSYKIPHAFPIPSVDNGLAQVISSAGFKQVHIAESEKRAHVTYFFNCLKNEKIEGEEDIIFKSTPDTVTSPEMQAAPIADAVIESMSNYALIIANLANADLLAHLGNYEATIKAVEAIDVAIGRIYEKAIEVGATLVITADHGNAEAVIYKRTAKKETRHDDNPVPIYLIDERLKGTPGDLNNVKGYLADVAPTILHLMNIEKPIEMTGNSII